MRVMKRFKAIFLALLVVLSCSLCACKSPEEEVIKLPDVHVGDEFEIIVDVGYAQEILCPLHRKGVVKEVGRRKVEVSPEYIVVKTGITFRALQEGTYRIRIVVVSREDSPIQNSSILRNNLYEVTIISPDGREEDEEV